MWPFSSAPKPHTGRIVTAMDVLLGMGNTVPMTFGKQRYAEVNSKAVVGLAQATRNALFSGGIPRWQPGATCTLFASRFASIANEKFFNAAWHEKISSELVALAVGECWFHPDTAPFGTDHAIGCAYTDQQFFFIDPQAPDKLRPMSNTELASIRNIRFL